MKLRKAATRIAPHSEWSQDSKVILFFHLVGDIHQPLHTAQLFTIEYPNGDRGGNEICVRVTQTGQPMDLNRFWDGVITSSSNLTRLRNEATALRNRQEF